MKFYNEHEIQNLAERVALKAPHAVPYARFLLDWVAIVNGNSDGWPYWSHHYHAASFWPYRRLPNLLAVHFNDLLADLPGQMRRVAGFLGIDVSEEDWPALVASGWLASLFSRFLPLSKG